MTGSWSTRSDVIAALGREWATGRLLAARVPRQGPPDAPWPRVTTFPLHVRLTGPDRTDLSTRWPEATRWAQDLTTWTAVGIEVREISHRTLGRQQLPAAAVVETADVAMALLRKASAARRFDSLVGSTPNAFLRWMAAHPHRVLEDAESWSQMIRAVQWLASHDVNGLYARQLDMPGVHTKVLETHKRTITDLLGEVREPSDGGRGGWVGGTATAAGGSQDRVGGRHWFEDGLGLRRKPALIRSRVLDPALALIPGVTDLTMPIASFASVDMPGVRTVFITENEINYLTLPDSAGALVIFGSGNEAPELLSEAGWIRDRDVHYWGDIDTHGFAILDRLRGAIPSVRSMLMDRATLLAHRDAWVQEPSPTHRPLTNLTPDESAVYADLCGDAYGPRVRLEQERISYAAVRHAVSARS